MSYIEYDRMLRYLKISKQFRILFVIYYDTLMGEEVYRSIEKEDEEEYYWDKE